MEQRTITLTVVLFVFVIAGMFGFVYLKKQELQQTPVPIAEDPEEDRLAYISRIDAKHFFEDDTHTVAGEIVMPTPCDLLETNAEVAESFPEQVRLNFTVLNNDIEFCAQILTPQRFKITFDASEEATIQAYLEGRKVILNLIEAEEDESPDDFELFIKG